MGHKCIEQKGFRMASQADRELRAAVEPVLQRLGYDLEDLRVSAAGRRNVLRVVIDRDGGFGLDDVADVSRELSDALDRDDTLPGSYVLEVSSPGVDRPLTQPRHWRRNAGRLVEVRLADGTTLTGRITFADETSAAVEIDGTTRDVSYRDVDRAQVQIELNRRTDAAPPEGDPLELETDEPVDRED